MLTTKSVGYYNDPETEAAAKANPKPVTGFDYAGQPLKAGQFYNGRPEHMDPAALPIQPDPPIRDVHSIQAVQPVSAVQAAASEPLTVSRTHRKHRTKWSLERRAALSEKLRNYWERKRSVAGLNPASTSNDSPS